MKHNKLIKIFESFNISVQFEDIDLNIPISYKKKYTYKVVKLETQEFLFVSENRQGSIKSFVNQALYLGEKSNLPIILVFNELDKEDKGLLIRGRIPFIDYNQNMFIPTLGLHLQNEPNITIFDSLTPNEQSVLITTLLNPENTLRAKDIANISQVSIPTVYRAFKKFGMRKWLTSEHGLYYFTTSRDKIYKDAKGFMINPISSSIVLSEDSFEILHESYSLKIAIAGTKALDQMTMLSEPRMVYAIKNSDYNKFINSSQKPYENINDNTELQLWHYQPILFSNDRLVDPISLILSLSRHEDPRVESEVNVLEADLVKKLKAM